jgi:RES domain-containing protein
VTPRRDFSRFPVQRIHPDRELYRIHREAHGPLWFAATDPGADGGRFDLPTASGFGTCYLSTSPVGAFLERFGRVRPVTQELVERCRLTILAPSSPLDLADITDRSVVGAFGITADISAGTDYERSRRVSMQLWEAGFDGIYYAARHDPSLTERSIALFGISGDQTADLGKRFDIESLGIPAELLREVADVYRLDVLPSTDLFDGDLFFDL